MLKWHLVWYCMQTSGWHTNISGHGAINPITESFSGRVQVVLSLSGHRIIGINDRCGFTNHPITNLPSGNTFPECRNSTPKFVAEYDRIIDWPTVVCGPLVEVTSTDSYISHFKQYIVRADFRYWYFTEFYRASAWCIIYNSWRVHIFDCFYRFG